MREYANTIGRYAALNRAVALGMRDGPDAGLAAIDAVLAEGSLDEYPLAHAARADMQRRLGLVDEGRASYRRALELTRQPAERRFLHARLAELEAARDTRRCWAEASHAGGTPGASSDRAGRRSSRK